ncbi:hypothetical protein D9981_13525 [Pseudoalteromonas phenolica O-BC30]|nr:hypothetical protein D9981_13525 [Pseudoalteromonas phenolica O-BC30]
MIPILNHFEGLKLTLASLKISYLEELNKKFRLAYMDVGTSARAGRVSGAIDKFFSTQNRSLN